MNGPVQLRQAKAACIVPEKWGLSQGVLVQDDPALINQQFDRSILRLVAHLFAVFDPVAEVDRFQSKAPGLADLPEDRVATQAATFFIGLVEGVDRR